MSTNAPGEPRFSLRKSVLFSVLIVGILLGGTELLLRVVGVRRPVQPRLLLEMLDVDVSFPFMRADPKTFWSPRPGWKGEFLGTTVSINALGLRSPELAVPKPRSARRLLCYGDSITFGYGVGDEDTYSRRLGELTADRGLQVVNAGVTGFTTHQLLAWLERTAAVAEADYATFCIGWNDSTRRPTTDRKYADRLDLVVGVEGIADRLYLYRFLKSLYARAALQAQREAQWTTPRVPPDEYRENLGRIATFCRKRGVKPAFVALPHRKLAGDRSPDSPYPAILRETARKLALPLLEVGDLAFETSLDSNGRLFIDSLHFSPEGHALLAAELERQLAALDWI